MMLHAFQRVKVKVSIAEKARNGGQCGLVVDGFQR